MAHWLPDDLTCVMLGLYVGQHGWTHHVMRSAAFKRQEGHHQMTAATDRQLWYHQLSATIH